MEPNKNSARWQVQIGFYEVKQREQDYLQIYEPSMLRDLWTLNSEDLNTLSSHTHSIYKHMQDRKCEAKSERHPDFNQLRKVLLNLIN